jgi:hypothetical protein
LLMDGLTSEMQHYPSEFEAPLQLQDVIA